MQAQLLRPSAIAQQHAISNRQLSITSLAKIRLSWKGKGRSRTVCVNANSGNGSQTLKYVSEEGSGGPQKSATESPNGFASNDVETQNGIGRQQLWSSTGTAVLAPSNAVRQLILTEQHVFILACAACVMTGAVSCLLLLAIPTLRSWRKTAISLEKLADAAREELPGTMAAVRLSGMEISDLTMELSDLGQEISAGVRSSSRAVRVAEAGLRRLGAVNSVGDPTVVQGRRKENSQQVQAVNPPIAQAAKGTREALIQARSMVHSLITLTRLSSWFGSWWTFIRPFQRKSIPGPSPPSE